MNDLIINALSSLGYDISCGSYSGSNDKYITFNLVDDRAAHFGDDTPLTDIQAFQVHFFAPKEYNHGSDKKQIRSKLFAAGFSYPRVTTLYENDTKLFHLVFECEISKKSETEEE